MNPDNYLYLSALLFTIGASGVLLRRNAIIMFMCVELMLNAANLAFVSFSRMHGQLDGQVVAFVTMVVAACEVVVGLAILMTLVRSRRSASVDDASLLKNLGIDDDSGLASDRPAPGRRGNTSAVRQTVRPVGPSARLCDVARVVRGRRRAVRLGQAGEAGHRDNADARDEQHAEADARDERRKALAANGFHE